MGNERGQPRALIASRLGFRREGRVGSMDPLKRRKSLSQALRKRKKMQFTVSDRVRSKLHSLAGGAKGNMSRVVEDLVLKK